MQTIKYTGVSDKTQIINFIPITPSNFAVISYLISLDKDNPNNAIIFEYPVAIEDVVPNQDGIKVIKGKAVPKFKNQIIKSPYRAIIVDPIEVANCYNWLLSTVVVDTTIQLLEPKEFNTQDDNINSL